MLPPPHYGKQHYDACHSELTRRFLSQLPPMETAWFWSEATEMREAKTYDAVCWNIMVTWAKWFWILPKNVTTRLGIEPKWTTLDEVQNK